MSSATVKDAVRNAGLAVLLLGALSLSAWADTHEKIRVAVGRGEVVSSDQEITTVAIAEPKIADATVGSARTAVITAKSPGFTTLVVYNAGGRYKVYDVEVYVPNIEKQVLLHVRVSQLTNDARRQLGLDLFGNGVTNLRWVDGALSGGLYTAKVSAPDPITGAPLINPVGADGNLKYTRNDGRFHFDATWQALEQKGAIRTLANPTLISRSGEEASFLSGGEVPVQSTVLLGGAGTITVVYKEFGVKVKFTPTVMDDGSLTLKVAPEVSAIDAGNPFSLPGLPVFVTNKAQTTVAMHAGEHLIIGGLKQFDKNKTVRRVPILGQIPIINWFCSSTINETTEKELLFVVSPEIVEAAATTLPELPTDRPDKASEPQPKK